MSKFEYSETEKEFNKVLKHQDTALSRISGIDKQKVDNAILSSEELLKSLGYDTNNLQRPNTIVPEKTIVVPSWDELCLQAENEINGAVDLEDLFTDTELQSNSEAIALINHDFKQLYKLDKYDYAISALAGIIGGAADILLVGIPHSFGDGVHKPLSDFIREQFEKHFPPGELENSKIAKVSFDAQDNRNTSTYVEGLNSYYHRLLSLGHDPLLGFIVGVMDIKSGTMTTVDKMGKLVRQEMAVYADRKEENTIKALIKLLVHFKSDVTTSMGLPAPLMGLFNFLQIGEIGPDDKTIAEIVQEMYHEGFDFIHFCSMSIPAMLTDLVVRVGYMYKRIREGASIKEAIPFEVSDKREKCPKLATMLFIANSASVAINTGKVLFTKDPCAINYPQWLAFAKRSYKQLKWTVIEKPELQTKYVSGKLNEELDIVYKEIDNTFNNILGEYTIIMNP